MVGVLSIDCSRCKHLQRGMAELAVATGSDAHHPGSAHRWLLSNQILQRSFRLALRLLSLSHCVAFIKGQLHTPGCVLKNAPIATRRPCPAIATRVMQIQVQKFRQPTFSFPFHLENVLRWPWRFRTPPCHAGRAEPHLSFLNGFVAFNSFLPERADTGRSGWICNGHVVGRAHS